MVKALTVFVVHGPSDGPVIVLWVVTAWYGPLSLSVGRTCEWRLTCRIWPRGWAVPSTSAQRRWRLPCVQTRSKGLLSPLLLRSGLP